MSFFQNLSTLSTVYIIEIFDIGIFKEAYNWINKQKSYMIFITLYRSYFNHKLDLIVIN